MSEIKKLGFRLMRLPKKATMQQTSTWNSLNRW